MAKYIISSFFILLVVIAANAQNSGEACPSFTCDSTTGNPGYITVGQVTEIIPDPLGRMIGIFTLNFKALSSLCKTYCSMTTGCMYWSHVKFTNDTAKCYLFKESACGTYNDENGVSSNPYSTVLPDTVSFAVTGKLCQAQVVGDPHFTGADGSHFDFTGVPGEHYCLLSDSHVHINAYYGGRYGKWGDNANKPMTWIRKLGIMWGHHTITLEAREAPEWKYNNGYMSHIKVDGEEAVFGQPTESISYAKDNIIIEWVGGKILNEGSEVDIYDVTIRDVIKVRVTLRPELAFLRTKDDGLVHMNIQISSAKLSENVHGVLGQTFRPDHQDRLSKQKLVRSMLFKIDVVPGENARGFIDGTPKEYKTSGLLKADCANTRFTRADALDLETAMAVEASNTFVDDSYTQARKFLFKQ